jgi:hypothetical protein
VKSSAWFRHRKAFQDNQKKDNEERADPACPTQNRDLRRVDRPVRGHYHVEETSGSVERTMSKR